jgi:DNA-binding MarR family transcriptional regulator
VAKLSESADPEELIEAISTVRRQLRAASGRPWPGAPLSNAEIDIVRLVRRQPGTSISAAARALGVAPNTVSTLVRRLDDSGWISTRRDDADGRVVRLELSPAARRRVERWRDARSTRVSAAIQRMTPAQHHDLARAVPALQALAQALREEAES